MTHPLDRPIWAALSGRQAQFAIGGERARRFDPAYAVFAAARDDAPESLAELGALVPEQGEMWLVQAGAAPRVPDTRVTREARCVQMLLTAPPPLVDGVAIEPLGEADAPAMRALAALTEPGPFFAATHLLGEFLGVREGGKLVAMAGERLRPPGFTELSGVCTHPDHRGRGLARALIAAVTAGIAARGETAFLTAYADNADAVALYEALGFRTRTEVTMTVLERKRI